MSLETSIRLIGRMALGFLALAPTSAVIAEAPKSFSRTDATRIIAEARRIVAPGGIERLEKVRVGGIDQWVSIRGTDKRNPVLLYLHGGPGYVSMPMSWWFARGWEEYFTLVQWDQRAAGKTYLLNDPATVAPSLTFDRMTADSEEMVEWIRKTLGKKKIFVLGHSWGSYLGLKLAERHPEWLYAYVGVGQLTNGPESERRGWAFTMDAARRDHNEQAIRDLNSVAPYFPPGKPNSLKDILVQRKWLDFYGGAMAHRQGNSAESDLAELSPDYSDEEIAQIWKGNEASEPYLLGKVLSLDLTKIRRVRCPLFLFEGRYDVNVNSNVAAEWFAGVQAPSKRLIWFENSAHLPMTEEPGKFLVSLVRYVRPLAVASH